MNPQEKGDRTESRAFQALHQLKDRYPEFLLDVRRSSPEMDARGIDCLVRLSLPAVHSSMTVPIEFKSSARGVEKWKVVHRDLHKAGVLVFYFPEDMSYRKMRRLMYRALERVRLNSEGGTLYHGMFQRLFRGGSRNLGWIVRMVKERRARKK